MASMSESRFPAARFLVAGPHPEGNGFMTPVVVRCASCEEQSPHYGTADGDDPSQYGLAWLEDLCAWAKAHQCGPALSPEAWARAARAVQSVLLPAGHDLSAELLAKTFAAGTQAVWDDIREACRKLEDADHPEHDERGPA